MARYGLRIFRVELRQAYKHAAVDVASTRKHYRDLAREYLQAMINEPLVGAPPPDPRDRAGREEDVSTKDEDKQGQPVIKIQSVVDTDGVIVVEFWAGTYGDHTWALGTPGLTEDADLEGRAPARLYRAMLNLPDKGTAGLLVVEDVSRSCPVGMLVRWLNRRSLVVEHERAVGDGKDSGSVPWWRLKAEAATDEARLKAEVRASQLDFVQLVKHDVSSTATRPGIEYEVHVPLRSKSVAVDIKEAVVEWTTWKLRSKRGELDEGEETPTDPKAARFMAALIGGELADVKFDDGWVSLTGFSGKRSISPSRASEIFVYPISAEKRPLTSTFGRSAAIHSRGIQTALQMQLDWPEF